MTGSKKRPLMKLMTVCVLLLLLTLPVNGQVDSEIENLNFRDANIRVVLETIAEIAEVNMVLDQSVTGEITIRLHEVSFDEALSMVTLSHGFDYIREGDILIVASPDRIEEIYMDEMLEIIIPEDRDPEDIEEVVNSVFPDINTVLNRKKSQLILAGGEKEVQQAQDLIDRLDFSDRPEDIIDIMQIERIDLVKITSVVEGLFPELTVLQNEARGQLILQGEAAEITRARDLIEDLDLSSEEQVIEIVKVNVEELDIISNIVREIYPEVDIHHHPQANRIIVYGPHHRVQDSIQLIEELDVEADEIPEVEEDIVDIEEEPDVKLVDIDYLELAETASIISTVFPELTVEQSSQTGQLVLKGRVRVIDQARDLISDLDSAATVDRHPERPEPEEEEITEPEPEEIEEEESEEPAEEPEEELEPEEPEEERVHHSLNLEYRDPDEVRELVLEIIPEVEISVDRYRQQLYITGYEDEVDYAAEIAADMDQEKKEVREVVSLDYMDLDIAVDVLTGSFPDDFQVHKNEQLFQLVLDGLETDVIAARELLNSMDQPREQVLIEARVEEISHTDIKRLGVDPDLSNINFLRGDRLDLPQLLDLIERGTASETLAHPRLMTLSGEEARLLIGDRVTFPLYEGGEVVDFETLEAGINLHFTPRVGADNYITLDVLPEVSTLDRRPETLIPDVNTREAETTIRLKDGETFVIGGLIQEDEIESIQQIPYLSQLPILGELFKHREVSMEKSELLIIITSHIIDDEGLVGTGFDDSGGLYYSNGERGLSDQLSPADLESGPETELEETDEIIIQDDEAGALELNIDEKYYYELFSEGEDN